MSRIVFDLFHEREKDRMQLQGRPFLPPKQVTLLPVTRKWRLDRESRFQCIACSNRSRFYAALADSPRKAPLAIIRAAKAKLRQQADHSSIPVLTRFLKLALGRLDFASTSGAEEPIASADPGAGRSGVGASRRSFVEG